MATPVIFLDGPATGGPDLLAWHLHADVVLLTLAFLGGYLYVINVLRDRIPDAGRVKGQQITLYLLGVAAMYLGAGSPIHDIAEHYLLSAHMLQHLLFSMVAAPLMLAGMPSWFWEWVFRRPAMLAIGRRVLNPMVAFGAFNFFIVVSHLPSVVDYALWHHWFHFVLHVGLLTTSVMMWWPILSNFQGIPRLSYPMQMGYLFVQSLVPAVIAATFTFSGSAVYPFYQQAPRVWGISAITDQQMAAGIMKLGGSAILWTFIGVAFFRWFAREEAAARGPRWDEVQQELSELGLNPKQ